MAGVLPVFGGRAMHDFWEAYLKYGCGYASCGAHLLRKLSVGGTQTDMGQGHDRPPLGGQGGGTFTQLVRKLVRIDLLVVDDWGMETTERPQYRALLELLDERCGSGSVLITSQYPDTSWHAHIGDPTVADAILDRLVHNAYKIEMKGKRSRRGIKES